MGVDMMLYVIVNDDYVLEKDIIDRFAAVNRLGWDGSSKPDLEFHEGWKYPGEVDYADTRVQVRTLNRYFDEDSFRRYYYVWPSVVEAVLALQVLFPGHTICYGSDSLHYAKELTHERFTALNEAWMKAFKAEVVKGLEITRASIMEEANWETMGHDEGGKND